MATLTAVIIIVCVIGNHGTVAAPPFPKSMTQGFRNAEIVQSAGKQAVCMNGIISVSASATITVLNLVEPARQFNASRIVQELFQIGSTIGQQAQGGDRLVEGTFGIGGTLCFPLDPLKFKAVQTLEILTHGVGLEKSYWDIAPGNSYADAAAATGYATFAYDRLDVGQSDHPDPIQVVQAFLEVEILHSLVQTFRTGTVGGREYKNIVGVGHSFGSILQVGVNVNYPEDFDAAILTAFTSTLSNLPYTILAILLLLH